MTALCNCGERSKKGRQAAALQMIEIINRQRKHKVPSSWRDFAERALQTIDSSDHDATIVFVSDRAVKKLNQRFRGKNYAADVLSFPTNAEAFESENQDHLGEVIVSIERAAAQAKANRLTLNHEVQQLILHGLLHLCGYDHETDDGQMNRLELKLRKKLGV